jgi:AcrR family transcriptional regulator
MTDTRLAEAQLGEAQPPGAVQGEFRGRLLDGLRRSIDERGYQDTTVTDVVRHARASRRTFYQVFATKDDCFVALMESANEALLRRIADAVARTAPWQQQAHQAVAAYLDQVAAQPALFLSWIREFPSLGTVAHRVRRDAMDAMVGLVQHLSGNPEFRRAGLRPASRELAIVILGGLRELTASVMEDGGDVRDILDVAVAATVALLATSHP